MKTKILITSLVLVVGLAFADGITPLLQLKKTNSSTSVPVQLATNQLYFRSATIYGKLHERTNNTGTVYIGVYSTNGNQSIAIAPGSSTVITCPPNSGTSLSNLWLSVDTANDGVVIVYFPYP